MRAPGGFLMSAVVLLILVARPLPAAVSPDVLQPVRALCERAGQGRFLGVGELANAMMGVVQQTGSAEVIRIARALENRAYCWAMSLSRAGESPLILVAQLPEAKAAVLWEQDGAWWSGYVPQVGGHPELLGQVARAGGREAFVADHSPGTAGLGRLVVLRQIGATWTVAFESPVIEKFQPKLFGPDHVLVTGRRGIDAPLIWSANCCVPTSYQWLFGRRGDTFGLVAERQAPDPYRALNIFFGALQAPDPEWAAHWLGQVATGEAVRQARRLKVDEPHVRPEISSAAMQQAHQLFVQEQMHWAAIPGAFQAPEPGIRSVKVQIDLIGGRRPSVTVTLSRMHGEWRVSALQ